MNISMGEFTEKQKSFMNNLFQQLSTTINETATEIRREFKKEIELLKAEVLDIRINYEKKIAKSEEEHTELQNRILNLERKQRKNNIIIFGIEKEETNIKNKVKTLCREHLKIDLDDACIREAYRLRNQDNSRSSPVLVSFVSYDKKIEVLKNTKKLQGKGIYITSDQCWEDRQQTKKLLEHQKRFRKNGDAAYIKDGKLLVANKLFTLQELNNPVIEDTNSENVKEGIVTGPSGYMHDEGKRERENQLKKAKTNPKEVSATSKISTRSQIKN